MMLTIEQVDAIRRDYERRDYIRYNDAMDIFDQAVAAFTLQAEVERLKAAQKWIPVRERLPKGECLLVRRGRVLSGRQASFFGVSTVWQNDYGTIIPDNEVTHWMPLPEPPKGDE